jgi:GNAT superfamily N-acetyltransferase
MQQSNAYAGEYRRILDGYAVAEDQLRRDRVFVAESGNGLLGFYSLIVGDEPELDLMFVTDLAQGTGAGRALFGHMRALARAEGLASVLIVSHPPSVRFYERMGAARISDKPPSGRITWSRPVLRLEVG